MLFMCTITGLYEKSPLSAKACHSLQCFHSKGRIITPWESSWLMTNNTQEFLVLCQKPWQKFWNCLLPWVCKWFALCDGQCAGDPAGSLCLTDPIRFCPTVTLWSTKAKQNTHLHALKHYQQLISVFVWQPQANCFFLNLSLSRCVRFTCFSHICLFDYIHIKK